MSTRTHILAAALVVAVTLASCGGGDDGGAAERPTVAELSVKFRNEIGTTPGQGGCIADVLVSSDISDEAMAEMYDTQLAQNEVPFTGLDLSDDDRRALGVLTDALGACLGQAPPTTAPTGPGSTEPGTTAPGSSEPGTTDDGATTAPAPPETGTGTSATTTPEPDAGADGG